MPDTLAANSSAVMGLWMKSVPGWRIAATARSTVGCAVTTTTGSVGSIRRTRSRNSMPLIRGISTSVITTSHGSASMCLIPDTGSSTCWTTEAAGLEHLGGPQAEDPVVVDQQDPPTGRRGCGVCHLSPSLSPSVPRAMRSAW